MPIKNRVVFLIYWSLKLNSSPSPQMGSTAKKKKFENHKDLIMSGP